MKLRWLVPLVPCAFWALLTGDASLPNLLFGLIGGLVALWLVRDLRVSTDFRVRPLKMLRLAGLFLYEVVVSAVRVLILTLSPRPRIAPGMIVMPLRVKRDFELALLVNLTALTPGTLGVDLSADRRQLLIHCLDVDDPDAVYEVVRDGFEALILEAFP